jgi:hypothetical protein
MVKCENCGHENDNDAVFCESCGANLKTTLPTKTHPQEVIKKEEGMSQSTKILIVVVIFLVAGLCLTVGLLFGSNFNKPLVINNTTNSSNTSTQTNSTNQTKINNTKSKYISENEAIRIAKTAHPVPGCRYVIKSPPKYEDWLGTTCYEVDILNPPGTVGPDGFAYIDAYTGKFLDAGT